MAGVTDVVHKEEVGAREGLCADLVRHESVQSTLHLQLRERLEVRDVEHGGLQGLLPNGLEHRELQGLLLPTFMLTFFLSVSYFLANFERPVLGCINADVCK